MKARVSARAVLIVASVAVVLVVAVWMLGAPHRMERIGGFLPPGGSETPSETAAGVPPPSETATLLFFRLT